MGLPAGSYGEQHLTDTFGNVVTIGDRVAHACSAGIRVGEIVKINVIWQYPNLTANNAPPTYSQWDVVSFVLERENGGVKKFLRYDYSPGYMVKL